MVQFKVRRYTPNQTDSPVSGSGKTGKEPDRTEPYHHYSRVMVLGGAAGHARHVRVTPQQIGLIPIELVRTTLLRVLFRVVDPVSLRGIRT
jgi:hypothetical protein